MMKAWSPTWGMGTLDYQPDVATFTSRSGEVFSFRRNGPPPSVKA